MSLYARRRPKPAWERTPEERAAYRRRVTGQIADGLRRRRMTGALTHYETGASASELMNGPKEDER